MIDTLSAEDPGQPQGENTEVMNAAFQVDEEKPSASQMEEELPSATNDQPPALSSELLFLTLFARYFPPIALCNDQDGEDVAEILSHLNNP